MADVLFDVAGGAKKRLVDMGDGSHAEVVAASGGSDGSADAEAYSDETGAADGTVIGLLKGIYVQNAQIISLLTAIETNTDTGGV